MGQAIYSRRIEGIRRAKALPEKPACIPASRPRGAKAAGLRFERALAKSLKGSMHGQWLEFEDRNGFGYCQVDVLFSMLPRFMVVIECKYTLVPGAHSKLVSLYLPVVEEAFGCPVAGVVVVKNLDPRYRRGRIYTNIEEAAIAAFESKYPTLIQWSGQSLLTPLLPRKAA